MYIINNYINYIFKYSFNRLCDMRTEILINNAKLLNIPFNPNSHILHKNKKIKKLYNIVQHPSKRLPAHPDIIIKIEDYLVEDTKFKIKKDKVKTLLRRAINISKSDEDMLELLPSYFQKCIDNCGSSYSPYHSHKEKENFKLIADEFKLENKEEILLLKKELALHVIGKDILE